MGESRHTYQEGLRELDREILAGLGLVDAQLARALEALLHHDAELATIVVGADRQINRLYRSLHSRILSLLALQAPVAGDLRVTASSLQIARCIERMGDQCANIAKLVPLVCKLELRDDPRLDGISEGIQEMGTRVHAQLGHVTEAVSSRDADLAADLALANEQLHRLDRAVLDMAVEIGHDPCIRECSMFMILAARALERIGGNTVEIGDQVAFVATGLFKAEHAHLN